MNNITDINKTSLEKVVKYYLRNDDPETAKNYIKTWGSHIKGYDVESELKKLELELNKPKGGKYHV